MKLKIAIFILLIFNLNACRENTCYDLNLIVHCNLKDCMRTCPEVLGCDGKTYCNTCIANCNGIRVVQ